VIKTLIFDLGKTLIPFDFEHSFRALGEMCGQSPAHIRSRIGAAGLIEPFERGLIEPEQFVKRLGAALEIPLDYGRFCEIWSGIFLPEPLIPESLIEALGARYRLLLLSNTNAVHFEWLERTYPMLGHFDDLVLSFRLKCAKPSPGIYREAIRLAHCLPEECFYTDDIAAYVEAARREGIDGVQFLSLEQLEKDMRGRGIDW
jgi:glucose-1-phosphatase